MHILSYGFVYQIVLIVEIFAARFRLLFLQQIVIDARRLR